METSKKDVQKFLEKANDDEQFAFFPRQSLKAAERFGTPYLTSLEQQISEAKESYTTYFKTLIDDMVQQFLLYELLWFDYTERIADHDMALASAMLVEKYHWSIPVLSD